MKKTDITNNIKYRILGLIVIIASAMVIIHLINSYFEHKIPLSSRATYQDITSVSVEYPNMSNHAVTYDIEHHPTIVRGIVDDINSQSTGRWRQSPGGKEGASGISIKLHRQTLLVASFTLYPDILMERSADYRQLSAKGMLRLIDIKDLPTLKAVWCDSRNDNQAIIDDIYVC